MSSSGNRNGQEPPTMKNPGQSSPLSAQKENDSKENDNHKEEKGDAFSSPIEYKPSNSSSLLLGDFDLNDDERSFPHNLSFFNNSKNSNNVNNKEDDEENQMRQSLMSLIYELSEKLSLVTAEVVELRSEIVVVKNKANKAMDVADDAKVIADRAVQKVEAMEENMKESTSLLTNTPIIHKTNADAIKYKDYDDENGSNEISGLSTDSYSLMMTKQVCSISWLFGSVVFGVQTALLGLIFNNQVSSSRETSFFGVPHTVTPDVRAAQCIAMMITICTSNDVIVPIKDMLMLRISNKEEWSKVVANILRREPIKSNTPVEGDRNDASPSGYHMLHIDIDSTDQKIWFLHILLPNLLKMFEGGAVMVVTFVVIVQSHHIIELFQDFAAMAIIAELDDVGFYLANHGYFGTTLRVDTNEARKVNFRDKSYKKCCKIPLRPALLFSILLVMISVYIAIVWGQMSGAYFYAKFPNCDIPFESITKFNDGECDGGILNRFQCNFDGGDCDWYNTAFPLCNAPEPSKIGNGDCDRELDKEECGFDGGDCCNGEDEFLEDDKCHGGLYNTYACAYDKGACDDFRVRHPNCVDQYKDFRDEDGIPIVLGDGKCSFIKEYMSEECGYEDNDCLQCKNLVEDLSLLGNGICNHKNNIPECGYDFGDCAECNKRGDCYKVDYPDCDLDAPELLRDGLCHGGDHNTKECGYDGGDCIQFNKEYPNCDTKLADPNNIGNGLCQGGEYNTEQCGYDGGDCIGFNNKYPKCDTKLVDPNNIGNDLCQGGEYNTEQCGYDGGDCLQFNSNYPECNSEEVVPFKVGDGHCDGFPHNLEQCGWDGGDCKERNDNIMKKYAECIDLDEADVGHLGDGRCHKVFNTLECGYDDNDCTEFNKNYPSCKVPKNPWKIGNGECDSRFPEYNSEECGWDGGDCIDRNKEVSKKYPDCKEEIRFIGDESCFSEYNTEECGWDGGDCVGIDYPNCKALSLWGVGNGKCDWDIDVNNPECEWDGGDCEQLNEEMKNKYSECPPKIMETKLITNLNSGTCEFASNLEECGWDGGDCIEINEAVQNNYANCTVEYSPLVGNGDCNYQTNTEGCDWDGGDCDEHNEALQSAYPSCTKVKNSALVGDDICDVGMNIEECGWDGGDCEEQNKEFQTKYPSCTEIQYNAYLGDKYCDDFLNTAECGWDGGDCHPACPVEYIALLGNGVCNYEANTVGCKWDEGDCTDANDNLQINFPNCPHVQYSTFMGDGKCEIDSLNIVACGWEGGDCILPNKYPNCPEEELSYLNNNFCNYQSNIEACGWDNGDCDDANKALQSKYPDCDQVQYSPLIGDGVCAIESLNVEGCGWDGGDCNLQNKYPSCPKYSLRYLDDNVCNYQSNTEVCGWDGGDCEASNTALQTNFPNCPEVQHSLWVGDGNCDHQTNLEACGWDGGDCEDRNKALQSAYPECNEVQYSTWIGDGKCDRQTNVEACGWDGGDCL